MSTPPLAFSNLASAVLAQTLTIGATVATVSAGEGALFPPVTAIGPDKAMVALEDVLGNIEICYLTEVSGDMLTLERAREGTAELEFPIGSRLECRITAGVHQEIDCGTF